MLLKLTGISLMLFVSACALVKSIREKSSDSHFYSEGSQFLTKVNPGVESSTLFEPDFVYKNANGAPIAYGFVMSVRNGGNFGLFTEYDEDGTGSKTPIEVVDIQNPTGSVNKDYFSSYREVMAYVGENSVQFNDLVVTKGKPVKWLVDSNWIIVNDNGQASTPGDETTPDTERVTTRMAVVIPASKMPNYQNSATRMASISMRNPDMKAEDGTIKTFKPATIFLTSNAVIDMAVFGDSVMWGQGVRDQYKYQNNVARRILGSNGVATRIYNLAHSGATIEVTGNPCSSKVVNGEVPAPDHYLKRTECQVTAFKNLKGVPPVDFVLTNGCANDVDLMTGVLPFILGEDAFDILADKLTEKLGIPNVFESNNARSETEAFNALVGQKCYTNQKIYYSLLKSTFPNSKFMITGYYSPLSLESKVGPVLVTGNMVLRSTAFKSIIDSQIKKAVDESFPREKAQFARIETDFTASGAGASGSVIWDYIGEGKFDSLFSDRQKLCNDAGLGKDLKCLGAGIIHPNPRGTRIYSRELYGKVLNLLSLSDRRPASQNTSGKVAVYECEAQGLDIAERCLYGKVHRFVPECPEGQCLENNMCTPSYEADCM